MRTAAVLLVLAPFVFAARSQTVAPTTAPVPDAPSWRYQPPASTPASSVDIRTPEEIRAANKLFDMSAGASDPLDGPQRFGIGSSGHGEGGDEDFPSSYRDEIVVAHFSSWKSYLSSSRRSIYTIVNLDIDRVVRDKSGKLAEGAVLPLYIPGGAVLAPGTGKVISYDIRERDFPLEPNTEYLFFLNHYSSYGYSSPTFNQYLYVKAWKVDKGVLKAVTDADIARVSEGRSTHNGESLDSAIRELRSH